MALFTVQPGRSFHAVQEVCTDSKPRLSISGWFHGETPPEGAEAASLNQLKGAAAAEPQGELPDGFERLPHAVSADDDEAALTAEERAFLQRWISPVYLGRAAERKMVAQWEASACVELRSFLRADVAAEVRGALPVKQACPRLQRQDAHDMVAVSLPCDGHTSVADAQAGRGRRRRYTPLCCPTYVAACALFLCKRGSARTERLQSSPRAQTARLSGVRP